MVRERITAGVATALAIGVFAAGCGGGTDGETAGNGSEDGGPATVADVQLSKSQYIKRGDAVCAKVPNRYNARLQKLPKKQQENLKVANRKAAVPPIWSAADELAEIGAPEGAEAKAQAIVAALEEAAKGLEKKPESPLSGPESPFVKFSRLTEQYGFQTCPAL